MNLKTRILTWLGIYDMLEDERSAHAFALQKQTEQQAENLKVALSALFEKQQAALVEALQSTRTDMKGEYEIRLGHIMEASIMASERIAKMVASQGDANLKEYVDGCLQVFVNPVEQASYN
jgi:hypothetical protein